MLQWTRIAIVAAVVALVGRTADAAVMIAYDNGAVAPNQAFNGALGLDFDVNSAIQITSLGVFNSGVLANLDGVTGAGVQVGIYDRATGTLVGSLLSLNSSSAVTQVNGNAFQAITPIILAAGFQGSVVAFNVLNYNSFGAPNPTSTENSNGGLISFVGGGRYGFGNVFPTIIDGGPNNRYDAGTFQFDAYLSPTAAPEPSTLASVALAVPAGLFAMLRRRRVAA